MNRVSHRALTLGLVGALLGSLGCGDDGGTGPDGTCSTDAECSDGIFCTGEERCVEGLCEMATAPCPAPLLCNESGGRCESPGCDTAEDADGDGRRAIPCGGDDCDDANADRFPGNPEICDGVDQDCDPSTLGTTDADGDGAISAACCDGATCGPDCDDDNPAVGPTGTETCDGVDDDCDGDVDEGVLRAFYPDEDNDNFGDGEGAALLACARGDSVADNTLDCDDGDASVNPTGTERCDGVDNNCNGVIDDLDATALSCTASFGTPPNTFFGCSDATCAVTDCAMGYGDCDGELSNGCETNIATDIDNCGTCGLRCGVGGTCTDGVCDEVVDVAAGAGYTCAVRSGSGEVVCWGGNERGQLGDFSTRAREVPVIAARVNRATEVKVARFDTECAFTCAQSGNLVYCWGCNRSGQVGDGDPEEFSLAPEPVNALPPVLSWTLESNALSLGAGHACTLAQGPLGPIALCWGANEITQIEYPFGSCADDVCETTNMAGRLVYPNQVSAGSDHTCFVKSEDIYCIGNNNDGQYGNGTMGTRATTNALQANDSVAYERVEAGWSFTCAILTAAHGRSVRCWGRNTSGQVGNGSTSTRVLTPAAVAGTNDTESLCVGRAHACALATDGTARCWGEGTDGQLGDGLSTSSSTPVVVGMTGIEKISCGLNHTCALDGNGDVWCWGGNETFQVGPASLGTTVASPTRVDAI